MNLIDELEGVYKTMDALSRKKNYRTYGAGPSTTMRDVRKEKPEIKPTNKKENIKCAHPEVVLIKLPEG